MHTYCIGQQRGLGGLCILPREQCIRPMLQKSGHRRTCRHAGTAVEVGSLGGRWEDGGGGVGRGNDVTEFRPSVDGEVTFTDASNDCNPLRFELMRRY
jgi:hypothetical protein